MTLNRKTFNRAVSASAVLTGLMDGNAVSPKAVTAAIKAIAGAGAKLDNQIHGTAVACIYLSMSVAEGGPATGAGPAISLLNNMPRGSRAKALAAWFEAFSNIRAKWDKAKGVWTGGVLPASAKGYAAPRPNDAMEKPFWSVEERDIDARAFTLGAALASLLAKAERAAKEGKLSPEDQEVVDALRGNAKVKKSLALHAAEKEAAK